MLSHHPSKFGGLRLCGSRYITILVVEDKIPHACLNSPLLLTSKVHSEIHVVSCPVLVRRV